MRKALTAAALTLALALTSCGDGDPTTSPTTPAATTAPALLDPATEPPADAGPPASDPNTTVQAAGPRAWGDGVYRVGVDIPPGRYVTTSGDSEYRCYWARLRSFGRLDSIIAEGNLRPGETVTVEVLPSDRGFKASNGCRWRTAP